MLGLKSHSESESKSEMACLPKVTVNNLLASWNHDEERLVLKDVSFEVNQVSRLCQSFLAAVVTACQC